MNRKFPLKNSIRSLLALLLAVAFALIVGKVYDFFNSSRKIATPPSKVPLSYTFYPMGGVPFELKIYSRPLKLFIEDSKAAEKLVKEIEAIVSSWQEDSQTTMLNLAAVGKKIELNAHLSALLKESFTFNKLTAGAFDPAIGQIVELWKKAVSRQKLPNFKNLSTLCRQSKLSQIKIIGTKQQFASRLNREVKLNFGGIAKGYMIDQVVELLLARGVKSAIVSAGGDLRIIGQGVARRVGIVNPQKNKKVFASFQLSNGAVATSGNYQRSYRIAGKDYGHIIDPEDCQVKEGPLAVTVIADLAITADTLATALFVLGEKKGLTLIDSLPNVEALLLVSQEEKIVSKKSAHFPALTMLD